MVSYLENKEVSTLTQKEVMLLFLAFDSRSVERSTTPEQTLKIVFTGTGGAPRSLYFSYIWFD